MWLGEEPIEGSAEAVRHLRDNGVEIAFFTNNSSLTIDAYVNKLRAMGVDVRGEDILSSAQSAADLLDAGMTAVVCGGPGIIEALVGRGVVIVDHGPADAVVVGWHTNFNFSRLETATDAVLAGALLIGTNDDATYPVRGRLRPGAGAILASVAYATGTDPLIAGKPNRPAVEMLLRRAGRPRVVVGDRPETDGELARKLGAQFALVLSGVSMPGGFGTLAGVGTEGDPPDQGVWSGHSVLPGRALAGRAPSGHSPSGVRRRVPTDVRDGRRPATTIARTMTKVEQTTKKGSRRRPRSRPDASAPDLLTLVREVLDGRLLAGSLESS